MLHRGFESYRACQKKTDITVSVFLFYVLSSYHTNEQDMRKFLIGFDMNHRDGSSESQSTVLKDSELPADIDGFLDVEALDIILFKHSRNPNVSFEVDAQVTSITELPRLI